MLARRLWPQRCQNQRGRCNNRRTNGRGNRNSPHTRSNPLGSGRFAQSRRDSFEGGHFVCEGGDHFFHFLSDSEGGAGVGAGYPHGGTDGPLPNSIGHWVSQSVGGGGVDGVVGGPLGHFHGVGGGGEDKAEVGL